MTTFVSRCPNCDTSFKVTEAQLSAADGAVRCGACLKIFIASDYFVDGPTRETADLGTQNPERQNSEIQSPRASNPETSSPETSSPETSSPETSSPETSSPETASIERSTTETSTLEAVGDLLSGRDNVNGYLQGRVGDAADPVIDPFIPDQSADEESETETIESLVPVEVVTKSEEEGQAARERLSSVADSQPEPEPEPEPEPQPKLKTEPEHPPEAELPLSESEIVTGLGSLDGDAPEELVGEYEPFKVRHRGRWMVGSLILLVTLGAQYGWFNKDKLAVDPRFRPYYQSVCNLTNCALPDFLDSSTLSTSDIVMRIHPSIENGLIVDAILRNESAFRQRFPRLQLRFADINGKTLAQRTFSPDTYLAGELAGMQYIPAATEVRLSLDIVDPGPGAVSYSMATVLN